MQYQKVVSARFCNRPNRFIAQVEVDGILETVHVKNTGRCKELLVPGCTVYLSASENPMRKTKYDLIATEKITENGALLINMDSQIPNDVVAEWLKKGTFVSSDARIFREKTHGASRFDFYIEDGDRRIFLEVKGCTLEKEGVALFPDAPTERGVKHLHELAHCIGEGFEAYVLFVIQMKGISHFSPNDQTHRAFGDALRTAANGGVKVLAFDSIVTPDSILLDEPVEVCL